MSNLVTLHENKAFRNCVRQHKLTLHIYLGVSMFAPEIYPCLLLMFVILILRYCFHGRLLLLLLLSLLAFGDLNIRCANIIIVVTIIIPIPRGTCQRPTLNAC